MYVEGKPPQKIYIKKFLNTLRKKKIHDFFLSCILIKLFNFQRQKKQIFLCISLIHLKSQFKGIAKLELRGEVGLSGRTAKKNFP